VTELEAMLEEVNNERDRKERKLNDTLKAMSQENYELRRSLEELRKEIRAFSSSRPYSDKASPRLEQPPHILQQPPHSPSSNLPSNVRHSSISYPPSMNQMASPAPSQESPMDVLDRVLELRLPVSEEQDKNKELPQQQQQQDDGDCGVCIKEDCICESLGIREKRDTPASSPAVSTAVESQQQPAPDTVQLKRRRKSVNKNLNPFKKMKKVTKPEEMEVDFTKVFAKEKAPEPSVIVEPPVPQSEVSGAEVIHSSTSTPMDPCGFCSDGTPCLCAETAEQEASSMADLNTLPPLVGINQNSSNHNSLSPSVSLPSSRNGSISNLIKLPALSHEASGASTPKSGCTGKPGTCQQCQADPMSTLFCTTLANLVATAKPAVKPAARPAGGCCGGSKSGDGGCCKDNTAAAASSKPQQQLLQRHNQQTPTGSGASMPLPSAGTFIPCSAAYQTLSRHKDFRRVDLGALVGKLQTKGMQVEVSSVANVLRELDKRLYQ
jgi:hypothetical protein